MLNRSTFVWNLILRAALLLLVFASCSAPDVPQPESPTEEPAGDQESTAQSTASTVRVAVFNIWELSEEKVDQLDGDGHGSHPQLSAAAEAIQRLRPDVLLLNEIDVLEERNLARDFIERYLAVPQHDEVEAIGFEHVVYEPVNTGVPSGFDLNDDGSTDGPDDAWGFGRYPGQYGMAVLTNLPVDEEAIRSWRLLRWRSMPGHLMPDGEDGRPAWYSAEEAEALRLSSKTHLDVPIQLSDGRTLHLLASHPTPPVFDGDEDRNGRRNFDEIRLWAEILDDDPADESWLVDDQGRPGGLPADQSFVIAGDLNADPFNDTPYGGPEGRPAIAQLLEHPRVRDAVPTGDDEPPGARVPADEYPGPPRSRTAAYGRIDYVLPSDDLAVAASGVFLPAEGDPLRRLVEGDGRASDHFSVWVDILIDPGGM